VALLFGGIMGFRVCLSAGLACVAVALAATAPIAPAQAGGSDISYNEVARFVMGGQQPAPGSYANGSFDGDFQAATAKKKGGLFGMISSAMSMVKNGSASTYYYLNNMERVDTFTDNTAEINLPDKNQVIHLDLANKTYWIGTATSAHMAPAAPAPPQAGPQQTMPPQEPGTAKVAITVSTTSLGSINVGGVNATGYKMSFKVVSSNATGSCTNGTFATSMTEYFSQYAEPSIKWPSTGTMHMPAQAPMDPALSSFKGGCKPTVTARANIGPKPPSGRLAVWELLTLNGSNSSNGQTGGGFSTVIERGDIRTLNGSDAGLFGPPAGFTQQQPPSQ
jgi:hypothetical protein